MQNYFVDKFGPTKSGSFCAKKQSGIISLYTEIEIIAVWNIRDNHDSCRSVILIRRSFDIYHEQQKISCITRVFCCWRKIWQTILRFVTGYATTGYRWADSLPLLTKFRQLPRNLGLHSKDRLLINQHPPCRWWRRFLIASMNPG